MICTEMVRLSSVCFVMLCHNEDDHPGLWLAPHENSSGRVIEIVMSASPAYTRSRQLKEIIKY